MTPPASPYDHLHQDEVWTNREGVTIPLSEIDARYARNIMSFLEARATTFLRIEQHAMVCVVLPTADMASYYFEQELDELFSAEPRAWLHDTALYRALAARA